MIKTCDELMDECYEKSRILKWLIEGSGTHCLPLSVLHIITKEWICKHYNMELSYFTPPINKLLF